jgi:3-isopropylmalate dehydrogenase
LLGLRQALGLFANLRPVRPLAALADTSPLRPEIVDGVDLLVVRELTGGLYFGKPSKRWATRRGRRAVDTLPYREEEIARVVRLACELAGARRGLVSSVDKANVLETSRLWREVAGEVAAGYPAVRLEHVLVDACAMHLISNPRRFDVIVTENLFGDVLSDLAAAVSGGIGLAPSASLADGGPGIFEPIHGSAPDIAGTGRANPAGAILSLALLLDELGQPAAARAVERALTGVLDDGARTPDLGGSATTDEVAAEVAAALSVSSSIAS